MIREKDLARGTEISYATPEGTKTGVVRDVLSIQVYLENGEFVFNKDIKKIIKKGDTSCI